MNVFWLVPAASVAAALVAVPILVHLLARHRSRRVLFPSLKFMPAAQLAALRRRAMADWPLLAIRMLIVIAAVAAIAGPVFVSRARRDAWNTRVVRAVITTDESTDVASLASDAARDSFISARFSGPTVPDAIKTASAWLADQPPAAREVVITGDIRAGSLNERDLQILDAQVGIRFLPLGGDASIKTARAQAFADQGADAGGSALEISPELTLTRVRYHPIPGLPVDVRVLAAAAEQAHADAVLRAVLRDGVLVTAGEERHVTVVFEGAAAPDASRVRPPGREWMQSALARNPGVRGGEVDGGLVAWMSVPATHPRAAELMAGVLRASFSESLEAFEPRRVPAARLAAWSRPPRGSPDEVRPADEGDRRWLWGTALLLMAVEHVMRRRKRLA